MRVKRCRERNKEKDGDSQANNGKDAKPKTRQQREKDHERKRKDRERKQKARDNWSHQKRRAESKKASYRYFAKKAVKEAAKRQEHQAGASTSTECNDNRTQTAKANAVKRLCDSPPKQDSARQSTIEQFISKHRDSKATSSSCLTDVILSREGLDSKENLQLKRLLAKKLKFLPKPKRIITQKELDMRTDQVNNLASKAGEP